MTRAARRPATRANHVPSRSRSIALEVASLTAASLLGGSVIDAEQSSRNTSIISSEMWVPWLEPADTETMAFTSVAYLGKYGFWNTCRSSVSTAPHLLLA